MMTQIDESRTSPFHSGEKKVQTLMGVREKMERFGRKVIRNYMPDQHREFYQQLPFIFVGHADDEGWPWASILFNPPGFIQSNDEHSLTINALPTHGDPLHKALKPETQLGLLGIELETRRRNRLAARISKKNEQGFELHVNQAFGNCPQYIQTRNLEVLDAECLPTPSTEEITYFDEDTVQLIANSDTFFVASYLANGSGEASEGCDVSHRGGRPGFIRIDNSKTLTIPDYLGNNHFNTFGNFIENNKAGLLFLDFENGHILTLTGTVEILWDSPDTQYFEGAERLWTFKLSHGRKLKNALPLRWKLDAYSPNTSLTGTWEEAEAKEKADQLKNEWRPYKVQKIIQESSVITSFYLAAEGHQALSFKPGQFLTIKMNIDGKEQVRTYTLSSAPADDHYRISVKREDSPDRTYPPGLCSNYLHTHIKEGDTIYAKAPTGAFQYDASIDRPALLIAGGVGITPMISMTRHALIEGFRTRKTRQTTFIGAAKNHQQRAFFKELNEISEASERHISVYWALSEVAPELKPGRDFHHTGHISRDLLQSVLALDDYDCYLCGPDGFMQACYDLLRSLGVSDHRIYAEAFGPAALKRDTGSKAHPPLSTLIAEQAIIEFSDSEVEQAWSKEDGSLLEFAESHGFTPEFSCRSGQCGACKVTLNEGAITYDSEIQADIKDTEVLLCCAKPTANKQGDLPRVSITL